MGKYFIVSFLFTAFLFAPFPSLRAHPGGTDANGCHTCKTNCEKWGLHYGQYHCHAKKSQKK